MKKYEVELTFDGFHRIVVEAKNKKQAIELVGEGQYDPSQVTDDSENYEVGEATEL